MKAVKCLVCDSDQTELIFTKPWAKSSDKSSAKHGVRRYQLCHHCGCYFLEKEFHLGQQDEFEHYEKHDNNPSDEGYRNYVWPVYEAVLRSFGPGACGLDYGAGPGPVLSVMLEEHGLKMHQWDPFYAKDDSGLKEKYDFVICSEVAEHFHRPRESWEHMKTFLRPGSKLYVMTCLAPSVRMFPGWHYHRDPTHVCFYTAKTMEYIKQSLGFQDVSVTYPRLSLFTL